MAYKPPKQSIVDNDTKGAPSNEAVFEALKLKLDEPTVLGSNGQLLQLDGYVSGEAVTSWVNPSSGLPSSDPGDVDKVLAVDASGNKSWRYAGLGAGSLGTGNVIVGRSKPTNITGTNNILMGNTTGNSLTSGYANVVIGSEISGFANGSGSSLTTGFYNTFVGVGTGSSVSTGSQNTYVGMFAGYENGFAGGDSSNNTFIGYSAGQQLRDGSNNTLIGLANPGTTLNNTTIVAAGITQHIRINPNNVVIGAGASNSGTAYGEIAIGVSATTTDHDAVAIGNAASASRGVAIGSGANAPSSCIALGRNSSAFGLTDTFSLGAFGYPVTTLYLGYGAATQTSATAVKIMTMRASGTDTNLSAGTLTLAGSQSTGAQAGGDVIIATAPATGPGGTTPNPHVERVRVTHDGKVGIGTTTPGETLEVNGAVLADEYRVANYRLDPHTHNEGTETTDFTINWANGVVHTVTLNSAGPLVITMSNPVDGGAYALRIIQGATPGTVTWPANVKWPGATPPVLSGNTGDVDIVNLLYFDDGGGNTYYYATFALAFA